MASCAPWGIPSHVPHESFWMRPGRPQLTCSYQVCSVEGCLLILFIGFTCSLLKCCSHSCPLCKLQSFEVSDRLLGSQLPPGYWSLRTTVFVFGRLALMSYEVCDSFTPSGTSRGSLEKEICAMFWRFGKHWVGQQPSWVSCVSVHNSVGSVLPL